MKKKFFLLIIIFVSLFYLSKNEKEEINLVIIDSGINRDLEKELPKNIIIKHYNSQDNDNNIICDVSISVVF